MCTYQEVPQSQRMISFSNLKKIVKGIINTMNKDEISLFKRNSIKKGAMTTKNDYRFTWRIVKKLPNDFDIFSLLLVT